MVNGNDQLVFEETHADRLEAEFAMTLNTRQLIEFVTTDMSVMEKLKEVHKASWDEYVSDSFNASFGE